MYYEEEHYFKEKFFSFLYLLAIFPGDAEAEEKKTKKFVLS